MADKEGAAPVREGCQWLKNDGKLPPQLHSFRGHDVPFICGTCFAQLRVSEDGNSVEGQCKV